VSATPLSDDQLQEALQQVQEHGSITLAANALGIPRPTLQARINIARRRFPEWQPGVLKREVSNRVPEGHIAKGVSTLYDADGNIKAQWVKTRVEDEARLAAIQEAIEAFAGEVERAQPITAPAAVLADLCNLFTFTDYHLGALAWHREGGADWDLKIAEETLVRAMSAMVEQSPAAHSAVINIQGDFLHTDGKIPKTPAHGHILDADSRYPKIRRAAIRTIRSLVRTALERHAEVHLIVAEGNHDEEGSGWLADCLAVHYEEEPRLTVNDSDLPFYVFEWGQTMLGVHHGHKVKNEQLPLLFASQFPEQWGRTKRREIHCGHRHHRDEKEYNGVTVVQHPTLAARDAYAARGGWIADRAAQAITYHKRFGQVGRVMVCPEMLEVVA
jgi:helix-turn-helix, Psq domain